MMQDSAYTSNLTTLILVLGIRIFQVILILSTKVIKALHFDSLAIASFISIKISLFGALIWEILTVFLFLCFTPQSLRCHFYDMTSFADCL